MAINVIIWWQTTGQIIKVKDDNLNEKYDFCHASGSVCVCVCAVVFVYNFFFLVLDANRESQTFLFTFRMKNANKKKRFDQKSELCAQKYSKTLFIAALFFLSFIKFRFLLDLNWM